MNIGKRHKKITTIATIIFTTCCLIFFLYSVITKWDEVYESLVWYREESGVIEFVILLMIVNILLESFRWTILRSKNNDCSFSEDIVITLRAIAFGNTTPGNIGEHTGRAWGKENKKNVVSTSILASIIQTAAISVGGGIGIIAMSRIDIDVPYPAIIASLCIILAEAILLILCIRYIGKVREISNDIIRDIGYKRITIAFIINLIRFAVFSFQLMWLIWAEVTPYFTTVLLYYFLITFMPRLNILDIGVKGGVAYYVFGEIAEDGRISAAIIVIWLINIIIPSLFGFASTLIKRKVAR